jgi:hypothetical protein
LAPWRTSIVNSWKANCRVPEPCDTVGLSKSISGRTPADPIATASYGVDRGQACPLAGPSQGQCVFQSCRSTVNDQQNAGPVHRGPNEMRSGKRRLLVRRKSQLPGGRGFLGLLSSSSFLRAQSLCCHCLSGGAECAESLPAGCSVPQSPFSTDSRPGEMGRGTCCCTME